MQYARIYHGYLANKFRMNHSICPAFYFLLALYPQPTCIYLTSRCRHACELHEYVIFGHIWSEYLLRTRTCTAKLIKLCCVQPTGHSIWCTQLVERSYFQAWPCFEGLMKQPLTTVSQKEVAKLQSSSRVICNHPAWVLRDYIGHINIL